MGVDFAAATAWVAGAGEAEVVICLLPCMFLIIVCNPSTRAFSTDSKPGTGTCAGRPFTLQMAVSIIWAACFVCLDRLFSILVLNCVIALSISGVRVSRLAALVPPETVCGCVGCCEDWLWVCWPWVAWRGCGLGTVLVSVLMGGLGGGGGLA